MCSDKRPLFGENMFFIKKFPNLKYGWVVTYYSQYYHNINSYSLFSYCYTLRNKVCIAHKNMLRDTKIASHSTFYIKCILHTKMCRDTKIVSRSTILCSMHTFFRVYTLRGLLLSAICGWAHVSSSFIMCSTPRIRCSQIFHRVLTTLQGRYCAAVLKTI